MLWLGPWGHQHSVLVRVDSDLYLTEMHLVAYLFQGLGVAAAALDIISLSEMRECWSYLCQRQLSHLPYQLYIFGQGWGSSSEHYGDSPCSITGPLRSWWCQERMCLAVLVGICCELQIKDRWLNRSWGFRYYLLWFFADSVFPLISEDKNGTFPLFLGQTYGVGGLRIWSLLILVLLERNQGTGNQNWFSLVRK